MALRPPSPTVTLSVFCLFWASSVSCACSCVPPRHAHGCRTWLYTHCSPLFVRPDVSETCSRRHGYRTHPFCAEICLSSSSSAGAALTHVLVEPSLSSEADVLEDEHAKGGGVHEADAICCALAIRCNTSIETAVRTSTAVSSTETRAARQAVYTESMSRRVEVDEISMVRTFYFQPISNQYPFLLRRACGLF